MGTVVKYDNIFQYNESLGVEIKLGYRPGNISDST